MKSASPTTGHRSPRRLREHQRKSEEVLSAAERVFGEKGFHGASMEGIARAADYAAGALYRYFKSKEALYLAVLELKCRERAELLHERAGGIKDATDQLRAIVRAQMEFASENRAFLQIFYREGFQVRQGGRAWKQIQESRDELIQCQAAGFAAGQRRGVFRKGDPQVYALALQGMADGLIRHWLTTDDPAQPLAAQAELLIELILRGLLIEK